MNVTDRELLQFAAKAAGYVVLASLAGHADGTTHWWKGASWGLQIKGVEWIWNPIIDDGDALRLAVKVGLLVDVWLQQKVCIASNQVEDLVDARVEFGADPYAATRRAIVRVAAEIGRNM